MSPEPPLDLQGHCPRPLHDRSRVLLAHGGGGRRSQELIEELILPALSNPTLEVLHDGAVLDPCSGRLAVTTDSFVVRPLFFPGGDIGKLAVHGTVNDLAMCGAQPIGLTSSLILEEGLPMEVLERVIRSMAEAARQVPVHIVTGDTKVVERSCADGLFLNTTGLGVVPEGIRISPERATPGDVVFLSGAIGLHGLAVLSVREGLAFETSLESDTAPLADLVAHLLAAGGPEVHVLRDPTRGGVASALNEIASAAAVCIELEEELLPIPAEVQGACEILGFDPLYVANEGKCLAIVGPQAADAVGAALASHPAGAQACRVGVVTDAHPGRVVLHGPLGGCRVVDMQSGEQLPRIC